MGGLPDAQLIVTFGWGHIRKLVYGYELRSKKQKENPVEFERTYETPYESSYEAPCLRFEFTPTARLDYYFTKKNLF